MADPAPRNASLTISATLAQAELPALLQHGRDLMRSGEVSVLQCELAGVGADLLAVEALARLELEARRAGCRLRLCDAAEELCELIALLGLGEVLLDDGARSGDAAEARTTGRASRYPGRR